MGHSDPLEQEITTHSSILAWRTPQTVQKDKKTRQWKMNLPPCPRLEGVQYATGEEQRAITNSSRKNEVAGSKQK